MKIKNLGIALMLAACVLVAGCSKDPAKAKSEFMASGDAYMKDEKYGEAIIQYRNALKLEPTSSAIHVALGQAYIKNNQPRESYFAYKRAAELDPNNHTAQISLGQFYLLTQQFQEALQLTQTLLEKNPNDEEAVLINASAFAGKKDYAEAVKIVTEYLAKHPTSVPAHLYLGVFYIAQNQPDAAFPHFQRAAEIDPKNVDARRNLATSYTARGDFARAEAELKAAITNNPDSIVALQNLANFYVGQKDYAKAEPVYLQIVKTSNNRKDLRMNLAAFYRMQKRYAEADATLAAIGKDNPEFLAAKYEQIEVAFEQGHSDDALRMAEEILKARPKEPMALIFRAQAQLQKPGNSQKAIADLEAAQKIEANISKLHYLMGVAYMQQGNTERAQSGFEEALKRDPNMLLPQLALADLMMRRGQYPAAADYADRILKDRPDQPDALFIQGLAQSNLRNPARAQAAFEKFVRLEPTSALGPLQLGWLAVQSGRLDVAEGQFRHSLELDPKQYRALEGLVAVYVRQKKSDRAESLLKEAAAKDNVAIIHNLLGSFYGQANRFAEAENEFNASLKVDPNNVETLQLLARIYMQQNAVPKALAQYELATQKNPNDPALWTLYGILSEAVGRAEPARVAYEKALQIQPNAGPAANNLAWILAVEGKDMDRALDLARRAKLAMPDSPSVSDTLAWVYYKRKLYDSALPLVQEALKTQPENANYHYHMAAILQGQGKKDQAKIAMTKALKLNAGLRNQDEVKRLLSELAL